MTIYKPNDKIISYDSAVRETRAIPIKRTDSQLLRSINDFYSLEHSIHLSSKDEANERKIALMKQGVLDLLNRDEVSHLIGNDDDDLLSRLVELEKKNKERKI